MSELLRRILFLPDAASSLAPRVDRLHFFIIVTTFIVGAGIGLTGLIFLVRYRRGRAEALAPVMTAPAWLEAAFAGVPLAFFLLWGALGFQDYIWARTPPREALDVYVTGKQWMWKFAYPGGPGMVGVLHVPTGTPVRLLLTSRDVIHSFYVPAFRVKMDALPGRYTEIWFEAVRPGRYRVLCAEYCGLDHSRMRAEVVALEPGAFETWRARQRSEPTWASGEGEEESLLGPLAAEGRVVAAKQGCLQCHTLDGTPHIGPTWLGLYGREEPLASGGSVRADVAYLTESMMDPLAKVVAGYAPVMPSFHGRLSAAEVGALIEFIKSLQPERPEPPPVQEPDYGPLPR
ncbi:cytochrome c oxidase subunit II [Comamonas sp. JC664]|uniref:cytochrome c oxidase subunit II n=1 Tax=Comamonas sp. JC664 TaxID=2801917 RepID=UPI001747F602|nr:cytochrome c oxidase subunit II [Comamonas sp. JC664]MBL0694414.1 cytochrome c oxidase subunit II [Comamonas sp. JC664]GHG77488.1 cytochrome c oxidase subunit 2 [Comamonas sp. KCTC 72670]